MGVGINPWLACFCPMTTLYHCEWSCVCALIWTPGFVNPSNIPFSLLGISWPLIWLKCESNPPSEQRAWGRGLHTLHKTRRATEREVWAYRGSHAPRPPLPLSLWTTSQWELWNRVLWGWRAPQVRKPGQTPFYLSIVLSQSVHWLSLRTLSFLGRQEVGMIYNCFWVLHFHPEGVYLPDWPPKIVKHF